MSTLYESKWAAPTPKDVSINTSTDDKTSAARGLSGAAATFSPTTPATHETPSYDPFAQTGAYEDELFDDVVPAESMQTRPQDDLFADDFTPAVEPTILEPASPPVVEIGHQSAAPQPSRGRGRGRGKGRGSTRQDSDRQANGDIAQALENAPTGPKKESILAVRGDRFATGGVKKPKLTEAELAEKMAQITIKNASLAAAHARAEADAASFASREAQAKVAAIKRDEVTKARAQSERKDRQQMMGEREKNRLRKLKAMEGREWDAEKDEGDFAKGGRFDGKGFAGDTAGYTDGREYLLQEPKHSNSKTTKASKQRPDRPPKQEEFPSLPGTVKQAAVTDSIDNEVSSKSWAEQVEASSGT